MVLTWLGSDEELNKRTALQASSNTSNRLSADFVDLNIHINIDLQEYQGRKTTPLKR